MEAVVRTVDCGGEFGEPVMAGALPAKVRGRATAIDVAIFSLDPQIEDPFADYLRVCPDMSLLPVARHPEAHVVLVLTTMVTDELLDEMATVAAGATNAAQTLVLVSGPLRERQLNRALGCGVVSFLPWAEATPRMVAQAIVASSNGRAVLPGTVARWLVDEARAFQRDMLDVNGLKPGGLTEREVHVLQFLADGHDTNFIAERLNYSERTIKKIIQDVMSRLGLRNRAHAVSYALRAGVI
jgi:DNA-binding NarL/FixJ family response regulator